jgi:hypothetical protein
MLQNINYICLMDFKKAIKDRGLKINWLAEKLEINRVLLSYYLNDTRPMPEDVKNGLKTLLT